MWGAEDIYDPGGYFAWGEITEKDTYKWDTYEDLNVDNDTFNKYGNNGQSKLNNKNDVAYINGIGNIPSVKQAEELFLYTDKKYNSKYNCYVLTSKKNGKELYIPLGGRKYGDKLNFVGDELYLWTNELYPDNDNCAYNIMCNKYNNMFVVKQAGRRMGQNIRSVI